VVRIGLDHQKTVTLGFYMVGHSASAFACAARS
jgi:hypothetical protein